jgi:CDP-diacylglycerol--serine O-phosphatidyltransferase
MPHLQLIASVTFLYTLGIAFLMVSRLPVFSGKRVGKRVAPEMVLPVFVLIVLFFALLISYPWEVLTIGTVLYLMTLPLGWLSYRQALRKTATAGAGSGIPNEAAGPAVAVTPAGEAAPPPLAAEHAPAAERPPRLN